ncbi:DNA-binding protein [Streptococcus thermophilus]|uniref:DNA-binding protein n=1 Tax=Streptococcus thermophilus TaxID=1308 RepID=UPI0038694016
MSRQKRSSRHSKKRKLISCFFGLHGSVCTFFKRIEILEKDCRAIKKENVAVIAIEHGYSIFSTKEEA